MSWITQFISYAYSCFVIWRTIYLFDKSSKRKSKIVVDIRDFNKIIQFDVYFMQLQFDLIFVVVEYTYINIFDCTSFFHQWLIKIANRHKLIVVTHKDSEQWNVTIMKFRNNSIYVQKKIDNIFRAYRAFVRVYVNDIVMFNHSLKKHLRHFNQIFSLFVKLNITLKFFKTYLRYSIISLLKQKIDRFDLSIAQKKLIVILKLCFSRILKDLEIYLDMIEWLRNYVSYYAQKFDVLKKRKIMLLKVSSSNVDRVRKNFSKRISIFDSTKTEANSYRQLQDSFNRFSWLVHQDFNRVLYVDVDEFRKNFDVMMYHLKSDNDKQSLLNNVDLKNAFEIKLSSTSFKRKNVESIMFLNRMLTFVEEKYWFIELKMIDLIWLMKRIKHLIETFKHITIIYIDHVVNSFIARQIKLITNNVNKLNMKLVRVSIYLFQFRLNVRYKLDKSHIIFDAFSRLSINNCMLNDKNDVLDIENFHENMIDSKNDVIYAYNSDLITMSKNFKLKLRQDYRFDKVWIKILTMFESLNARLVKKKKEVLQKSFDDSATQSSITKSLLQTTNQSIDVLFNQQSTTSSSVTKSFSQTSQIDRQANNRRTDIDFQLIDELIYHIYESNDYEFEQSKLCIFEICQQNVFKITHDDNFHVEHHRVYRRLMKTVYMSTMSRKLRMYLRHCFKCQLNQIKRHNSYDELMFIFTSSLFFHTIAMNFVLTLSLKQNMNTLLNLTNKISRQLQIIIDRADWFVAQWINVVVDRLLLMNWDISKIIIFDWDKKFTSNFWIVFFAKLDTILLMNNVYHAQTNDLSERFNQTVKIVLRYLIAKNSNIDWIENLSTLQTQLNNASNAITDRLFNEMMYEFKLRDVLIALTRKFIKIDDVDFERFRHQRETIDVILYVMTKIKIMYDARHILLLLKSNDKVFLRLHKKYTLLNKFNIKLFNQRVDSFLIKRRIERLIYELNFSFRWQIHFVIFVIQLKSTSSKKDSYQRFKFDFSIEIEIEEMFNIEFEKNFEMKIIMSKRIRIFNKTRVTQYLIRWKDWNSIYDEWKNIVKLIEFIDLVEKYERQHSNNDDLHQSFEWKFSKTKKFIVIQQSKNISVKRRDRFDKNIVVTSLFIVVNTSTISIIESIFIVTKSSKQLCSRRSHISRSSISTSSSFDSHYY